MKREFILYYVIFSFFLTAAVSAAEPKQVFISPHGLGPDKWASAWLIKRYIDPNATIVIGDINETISETTNDPISFDSVNATYRRTQNESTFEVLATTYNMQDPTLLYLASIIHDIEINLWRTNARQESLTVEQAFRELQRNYGGDNVGLDCYLAFFDNVYHWISKPEERASLSNYSRLVPDQICRQKTKVSFDSTKKLVPEITTKELFSYIRQGKKVVFVDTRERNEFLEAHIPNAINIPIRTITDKIPAPLRDADIVISYCVKDFRGFEMARILRSKGLMNTAILNPYGIRGWIDAKLPVAGSKGLSESQATKLLNSCIHNNDCRQ